MFFTGQGPFRCLQAGEALADDAGRLLECAARLRLRAEGLAQTAATFVFSIPSNTPRESSFRIIKRFLGAHPGLSLMMASDADHETVLEGGVDAAYLAYVPEPLPNLRVRRWARSATCQSLRPTMSRAAVCPFIRRSSRRMTSF